MLPTQVLDFAAFQIHWHANCNSVTYTGPHVGLRPIAIYMPSPCFRALTCASSFSRKVDIFLINSARAGTGFAIKVLGARGEM